MTERAPYAQVCADRKERHRPKGCPGSQHVMSRDPDGPDDRPWKCRMPDCPHEQPWAGGYAAWLANHQAVILDRRQPPRVLPRPRVRVRAGVGAVPVRLRRPVLARRQRSWSAARAAGRRSRGLTGQRGDLATQRDDARGLAAALEAELARVRDAVNVGATPALIAEILDEALDG